MQVLPLLVLVQLPKKEAGLGTAFGGGTTDALFGAGAGNVLTTLTKWCAILFLVLCLLLSMDFMKPRETSEADMAGSADKTGNAASSQLDSNASTQHNNNASTQHKNN